MIQFAKCLLMTSMLSISLLVSSLAFAESSISDIKKQAQRHYEKANQYILKEAYDKAIVELRQAIKLVPQNTDLYGNLGLYLSLAERHEKSKQASEHALLLAPDNYAWSVNLGHVT